MCVRTGVRQSDSGFLTFDHSSVSAFLLEPVGSRLAASAPSGNLLEIWILGLHPRLTESGTLGVRPKSLFKSPPGDPMLPEV